MKKKVIPLFVIVFLGFSLVGCVREDNEPDYEISNRQVESNASSKTFELMITFNNNRLIQSGTYVTSVTSSNEDEPRFMIISQDEDGSQRKYSFQKNGVEHEQNLWIQDINNSGSSLVIKLMKDNSDILDLYHLKIRDQKLCISKSLDSENCIE